MKKYVIAILAIFFVIADASAARYYQPYGSYWRNVSAKYSEMDCATLFSMANLPGYKNPSCPDLESKLVSKGTGSISGPLNVVGVDPPNSSVSLGYQIEITGSCVKGRSAGNFSVLGGYVNSTTGDILQNVPVGDRTESGCIITTIKVIRCWTIPAEAVNNVSKAYCEFEWEETGQLGSNPSKNTEPPYTGPGSGTDPGSGGGTDPGSGGGTDPGSGGGTDPGSGGGTDPGSGGGTDPGSGGGTDPGSGGGTDPGGGTGGGGGSGDSGSDFCQKNPTLNVCRNSTFNGTCGNITCLGDAVQCELLRQEAEMNCRKKEDDAKLLGSDFGRLGESLLKGNDPDAGKIPSRANAKEVDFGKLDSSGWLGGGSCFADKSITVMGRTIQIPFSQVCSILVAFRYAIMIAAMLISFNMLRSTVLGV